MDIPKSISPEQLAEYARMADNMLILTPRIEREENDGHATCTIGDLTIPRPLNEPLADLIRDHLKGTFGQEWADAQMGMPLEEQHAVFQWCMSLAKLEKASDRTAVRSPEGWTSIAPTGDAMSFMSLGHDLLWLRAENQLRPKMINRLKNKNEFQGARYECAIAAAFLRSNFSIEWAKSTPNQSNCEFLATHNDSGEQVVVEAKSRHRPGAIHRAGEQSDPRLDVNRLYKKACSQCPDDVPSAIFIDANLPSHVSDFQSTQDWLFATIGMLSEEQEATSENPAVETCLVITNYGWHYANSEKARGLQTVHVFPQFVRATISDPRTYASLIHAFSTCGQIPPK